MLIPLRNHFYPRYDIVNLIVCNIHWYLHQDSVIRCISTYQLRLNSMELFNDQFHGHPFYPEDELCPIILTHVVSLVKQDYVVHLS